MKIFSPQRVGSRVIIKILNEITDEHINWTNTHCSNNCDFVFIRDFRDITISWWRTILSRKGKHNEYLQRQITKDELLEIFNNNNKNVVINMIEEFEALNKIYPNTTKVIKYEDWHNNFSVIFQHFPKLTEIKKKQLKITGV